jgi:prepilin-type N-terminal cleavage/methylation domain-containing protein
MPEQRKTMKRTQQSGFTMIEMMTALAVFLVVSSIVVSGMVQMIRTQGTVANRTEMHTSVRSATELLQQEIGQAGRISLPTAVMPVTMTGPIAVSTVAQTVNVSSTVNIFQFMLLDVDAGQNFEVVTVTAVGTGTITAVFTKPHAGASIPVQVSGSFGTGIVPPASGLACATSGYTPYAGPGNGSDCNTLKLYGDINGDGNILYVEYKCDTSSNPGFLYRNEVPNAVVVGTTKPAVNSSMYLLNNVEPNPDGSGCFNYQVRNASVNGISVPFVTDVAVTLTVQTQLLDPVTNQYQRETKALLNITPRNVFYVWEATSLGEVPRNQPMPANVAAML